MLESVRMQYAQYSAPEGWERSSSGLFLPDEFYDEQNEVLPATSDLVGISFFSGCGGFDLGMHQAGFRILAANDVWAIAAITYCWNLGTETVQFHFVDKQDRIDFEKELRKEKKDRGLKVSMDGDLVTFNRADRGPIDPLKGTPHFFLGDIRKLSGKEIVDIVLPDGGDVDVVFGGPPCQGFSMAGRRDIMDPRNSLVFDFARLIVEINPKTFIMENVPGIVSMVTPEGVPVMDAFCSMIANGGYGSYESLKRALTAQANALGGMRGQGGNAERMKKPKPEKKPPAKKRRKGNHTEQLTLFQP